MTQDDVRLKLAAAIEAAAVSHNAGNFDNIDNGYADLEPIAFRHADPEVRLAMSFWDGWIDSRNHDWRYYEPIGESDWPRLAHSVASALRDSRPISVSEVLRFAEGRPAGTAQG